MTLAAVPSTQRFFFDLTDDNEDDLNDGLTDPMIPSQQIQPSYYPSHPSSSSSSSSTFTSSAPSMTPHRKGKRRISTSSSSSSSTSPSSSDVEHSSSRYRRPTLEISSGVEKRANTSIIDLLDDDEDVQPSRDDSRSEPLNSLLPMESAFSLSRREEKSEDVSDEREELRRRTLPITRKRRCIGRGEEEEVEILRIVRGKQDPEAISSESDCDKETGNGSLPTSTFREVTYDDLFGSSSQENRREYWNSLRRKRLGSSSSARNLLNKSNPISIDSDDDSTTASSTTSSAARGVENRNETKKDEGQEEEEEDLCPICLCPYQNPAIPDGCTHTFCFVCILQWSEINTKCLCPLCKSQFHSLYHNIVSEKDFQVHKIEVKKVPVSNPRSVSSPLRRVSRFTPSSSSRYHGRSRYYRDPASPDRDSGNIVPYRRAPPSSSIGFTADHEYRRRVYTNSRTPVVSSLPPDCRKPATSNNIKREWRSRIEQFARRDIQSITWQQDVEILLTFLEVLLQRLELNTGPGRSRIEDELKGFLFGDTKAFVRELQTFIESGLSMRAYDITIQYL